MEILQLMAVILDMNMSKSMRITELKNLSVLANAIYVYMLKVEGR